MKYIALITIGILLNFSSIAQKMYVWCPEKLIVPPRANQLKNVEIKLVINDYRLFSEKSNNKCSTEELKKSLFEVIESSFPDSKGIRYMDEKTNIASGEILIEITISAYSATFNAPMWFAETGYELRVIDLRNEHRNEFTQSIRKEKRFYNVGGFATAKNNLSRTYREANTELLNILSDKLRQEQDLK